MIMVFWLLGVVVPDRKIQTRPTRSIAIRPAGQRSTNLGDLRHEGKGLNRFGTIFCDFGIAVLAVARLVVAVAVSVAC
jgi:hypothetical protein